MYCNVRSEFYLTYKTTFFLSINAESDVNQVILFFNFLILSIKTSAVLNLCIRGMTNKVIKIFKKFARLKYVLKN